MITLGSTKSSSNPPSRKAKEGRFPVNPGITGFVAATGETINIANAYEDNRFDPTVSNQYHILDINWLINSLTYLNSSVLINSFFAVNF